MVNVVRVQNPKILGVKEIQELFTKAFKDNPFTSFEDAAEDFVALVADPQVGVFIGAEKGEFKGLVIIVLPMNKLAPLPQVYQFHSSGSSALKKALIKAGVDFVVENGYTRFLALNVTSKADEAYGKLFKVAGKSKKVGSLLEFEIG